jgi:hypothetical protein
MVNIEDIPPTLPTLTESLNALVTLWNSPEPSNEQATEIMKKLYDTYHLKEILENGSTQMNPIPLILIFVYDVRAYAADFLIKYYTRPTESLRVPFYQPPKQLSDRASFADYFYRVESSIYAFLGIGDAMTLNKIIEAHASTTGPFTAGTLEALKAQRHYQLAYSEIQTQMPSDSTVAELLAKNSSEYLHRVQDLLLKIDSALNVDRATLSQIYSMHGSDPDLIVRNVHDACMRAFFTGLHREEFPTENTSPIEQTSHTVGISIRQALL